MPVKKIHTYTIQFQGYGTDYADATTYYFGMIYPYPPEATWNIFKIKIPRRGIIRRAEIQGLTQSVAGSGEDWTLSIRLNDTTDYPIATVASNNPAQGRRDWTNNALNIPVVEGDFICIKTTCPTWVTNPTQYKFNGFVLIEY